MTYELANKLRESGFHQYGKGKLIPNPTMDDMPNEVGIVPSLQVAYLPTLSELIEACGMSISGLARNDPTISYNFPERSGWVALTNRKNELGDRVEFWGSTPEEAVANLWLKLNEK